MSFVPLHAVMVLRRQRQCYLCCSKLARSGLQAHLRAAQLPGQVRGPAPGSRLRPPTSLAGLTPALPVSRQSARFPFALGRPSPAVCEASTGGGERQRHRVARLDDVAEAHEEGPGGKRGEGDGEEAEDEEEEWVGAGRTLRADPPLQWGLGHKKPPQETQP